MFKNKKILSLIVAFLFIITSFMLPLAGQLVAFAESGYIIARGSVLTIKQKAGIEYKHEADLEFDFKDFSEEENVEVIIYNPTGDVLRDWESVTNAYTFENIGLHALQFRVFNEPSNIYTYSLNYYVNVYQQEYKFVLNDLIVHAAKSGTSVKVPTAKYLYKNIDNPASIKVYNPYGIEVEINDGKFITSDNLVGNYCVEYYYESEDLRHNKFFTIAVSKDFVVPSDLAISIPNAEGQIDDKNTIDVFKYYNLKDTKLIAQSGSLINSKIMVSIFNQSQNKYYVISEGKWIQSDIETAYDLTSDEMIEFVCNDITSFAENGFGKSGDTLVFNFSALSCYGQTIKKSITKSLTFNDKMFSIDILGFVPSKINADIDTTLTSQVSEETQTIKIAGFNIIIANDYDSDAIFNAINFEKKATASSNGVVVADGDGFKLSYPESVRESYSFSLVYNIVYSDKAIVDEETSYTLQMLTKSVTVAKLALENVKPNNIKLGEYNAIHRFNVNEKFLLPQATADFYYEINASSYEAFNKYNFTVYINDSLVEGLMPGDETNLLNEANTHKITYRAQGYYGDFREFSFYIKSLSESDADTSVDFAIVGFAESINGFEISNSTGIDQAVLYDASGNFIPVNNIYNDGCIVGFDFDDDFEIDENETYFTTFISNSYNESSYYTIAYYEDTYLSNQLAAAPIAYTINSKFYEREVVLEKYATTEITIGQGVIVLDSTASGQFSFMVSSPNYYVNNGAVYFYKAGNYTLTNGNDSYYVKVLNDADIKIEYLKPVSPVARVGSNISLLDPVLTNSFGYALTKHITKSNGNDHSNSNSFEIDSVDNYKISYKFTTADGDVFIDNKIISAGNITKPTIIIEDSYKDIVFEGGKKIVNVISSYGNDKNGAKIKSVLVEVYDPFGKKIDIIDGKFEVDKTGVYVIYYTLSDSDGIANTEKVTFVSAYENVPEKTDKLPVWAIVLISVGGIIVLAGLVLLALMIIKKSRLKKRFISKSKTQKKQQKSSQKNIIYSIAPSKDNKQWFVKKNNKMFAKCKTRDEAMQKVQESKQVGDEVKVYNKSGRLIDTIK